MTDWTQPELTRLYRILANLYPMMADGMRLAQAADLSRPQIEFSGKAFNNWSAIIQRAKQESKVDSLLDIAIEENPGDEALRQSRDHNPPPAVEGPAAKWAAASTQTQLEKILGDRSTLVSISYLELGLIRSRSVARIKAADGSSGTGFVTANKMLITNNHVLPDVASATAAIAQFNYQKTAGGLDAPFEEFSLAPDEFFRTSKDDDWTAVRIKGDPAKWGELEMKPVTVKAGDHVNIIQHPGGAQKQISFAANLVAFIGGGRIQYLTDTLPGSSGSPVFDTDWNLIALHHSGGWLTEPDAGSKSTHYRNEGIAIHRVIEGLAANP